tara:strand:+ start:23090 stop:24214 length:1125 start_codon:yes stop_codon:yes gene_type:complete
MIPFNKPYLTGRETEYIAHAVASGKISGNGEYTKKCQTFFEARYRFAETLLTTSCTDALEMAALLINCKEGDEVLVPSYTFVSSALAFVREGAKVLFVDSQKQNPNMDVATLEPLITKMTKAIVVVHYAGVAVDMDTIMALAKKYNLYVIEDAAQAVDATYKGKPLGGIGHLGCFSFHETKNIISGEGGMLVVNDEKLRARAEVLWEKGTNRASFFRGEINKYGWVDTGSSFLPSEIVAAFLYAQLENLDKIQDRRKEIWTNYYQSLRPLQELDKVKLPVIPEYASNNAHMFYLVCNSIEERSKLIVFLKSRDVHAVFHYLSLHKSEFYLKHNELVHLPNSDKFTDCLVRLPFFYELSHKDQNYIIDSIIQFYA